MSDPVAAKYVHPYVGARELLHGERRWCLWLEGMDPADLTRSKILKGRVDAVAAFRAKSRAASTRNYPFAHLFRQLAKQDTGFVGIPIHVSGVRSYYPVAHFESDVIACNANFTIKDPDGFQFAIISSSMFITWQKTIGGRIKSDPRFASTLTWNTLPLPEVDPALRRKIIEAGKGVLAARDLHPERSLAQQYMSNAMDPELVRAHNVLDRLVDRAFGATRALTTEAERQKLLFSNYREMTSEGQLGIPAPSKRRRR